MEDPIWVGLMIWATWLLIAILIDGVMVPYKMYLSNKARRKLKNNIESTKLPRVSVVIPAHNEEEKINDCIVSLVNNEYPAHKMEIIIVDDGSKDNTRNIVKQAQVNAIMSGKEIKLIEKGHTGKVHTLNTGLKQTTGDVVITIDADTRLAHDAIKNIVIPFVEDENVGAATGYIEVRWDNTKKDDFLKMFFSKSEFLEYLSSFNFERTYQSIVDSVYTMSGAFSAFRRNIIGNVGGYWPATVSEDMHVTMMLHHKKVRIVNVPEAIAYVDAITDYDTLYSQRVRWARGQLEVASMHQDTFKKKVYEETTFRDLLSIIVDQKDLKLLKLLGEYIKNKVSCKIREFKEKTYASYGWMGLQRILLVDHTIAFPRLIWVFILIMFPILGLYVALLPIIVVLMYAFYVFIDSAVVMFAYHHSNPRTRKKIEESFHYVLLLPIYRLMIFCFRVSAFLHVLNEPPGWKVAGPVNGFKNGVNGIKNGVNGSIATAIFQIGSMFNFINLMRKRGK